MESKIFDSKVRSKDFILAALVPENFFKIILKNEQRKLVRWKQTV